MKKNFILGKKQIILASLVVILGAAVYLNWQFANSGADLDVTDQVNNTASQVEASSGLTPGSDDVLAPLPTAGTPDAGLTNASEPEPVSSEAGKDTAGGLNEEANNTASEAGETKMLGDAKFVSSSAIASEDYFSMAKLSRTRSRDEAIETVATILDNTQLTDSDKQEATAKAMAISDVIEMESRIENLVKAKGFAECMAYLTDSTANIVVQSNGLTQDQATQIKNIVVAEGKIKGENITITEIC